MGAEAALIGAAGIGGVTSLLSGFIGSKAAKSAATIQEKTALAGLALQKQQYDQSRKDMLPWMAAGKTALAQYQGELGLAKKGADGKPFKSQFEATPGYAFQVAEAEKGAVNNLAALGMRDSGAALKALTRTRLGLAAQEHGNYLTRLSNLATGGQQQTQSAASLGSNFGVNASNTLQDSGAARASGYVGGANAWTNALTNVGNVAGGTLGWGNQLGMFN